MELIFKEKTKEWKGLKNVDEMSVVTSKVKIQAKLKNRGTVGLVVVYPPNHADDVYRVLNPKTNHVIKPRDILWLKS